MPEPADYPKKAICGNCGQTIFIHWSWKSKKEYAKNVEEKKGTQWHQCQNWKPGHKLDMREYADTPPAAEPKTPPSTLSPAQEQHLAAAAQATGLPQQYERTPPTAQDLLVAQGKQTQSVLKVSKITIEYVASKLYEKTEQVQQFEPEKKGEFNSLKLGIEIDVEIYNGQEVVNATKDYIALLRNNVKKELGL